MAEQGAEQVRTAVREHYAEAARTVGTSCCGPTGTTSGLIGRTLYEQDDTEALPDAALARITRLREPHAARRTASGRGRPRPRLRWRD